MFVLIENEMVGSVTIKNHATVFDVPSFQRAVNMIKEELSKLESVHILRDEAAEFIYTINNGVFVTGIIRNEMVKIIKDEE